MQVHRVYIGQMYGQVSKSVYKSTTSLPHRFEIYGLLMDFHYIFNTFIAPLLTTT